MDWTQVRAPNDGFISRRYKDPGNLVKADDTLLSTIISLDPMYAYFDVDERSFLRMQELMRAGKIESLRNSKVNVKLGLSNEPGFPHDGIIDFVDNRLDVSTGTIRLRAEFANPKFTLYPGLFARVRIQVGAPRKAVLVPERALGTDQGQNFVYVVNEKNEAVYHGVTAGSLHDGLRVIETGLDPQERVIVAGMQRVRPNAPVNPELVDAVKVNAKN
jgi:RND family efflux transporter MFP subunit